MISQMNTSGDEGSDEGGTAADPHFDSLINLNVIADKAKDAK